MAHFLHVGKTAGTALKLALRDVEQASDHRLVLHTHHAHLPSIPEDDAFFFCVREPASRFVSGFLSRQREGKPRHYIPWREDEALAFSRFDSPDGLAVALSAGGREQRDAEDAMRAIRHVQTSYWDWFVDPDSFRRRAPHVLWVGRQEALDVAALARTLGLESLDLPSDPIASHRYTDVKPELSALGVQNLRDWYAADYEFLELCDALFPRTDPHAAA